LALIVVIATVVGFYAYFITSAKPEPYNTMYLLDNNGKAVDYPQTLVAGQNSTFSINVAVVNHMNSEQSYQLRTKIAKSLLMNSSGVDSPAIDTYGFTLPDKGTSQHTVTVAENTPGSYVVVYELWSIDGSGDYSFTGNYCVLNIQVIN
jgi:Predicted membrane protein